MSLILDTDTCIDVLIGATALEMNWPLVTSNLSVGQQWHGEIARTNTMGGLLSVFLMNVSEQSIGPITEKTGSYYRHEDQTDTRKSCNEPFSLHGHRG